jgi:hypothetical protein
MKRSVIAVLTLLAVAGLGFGQRGRGNAGGAAAGSMPQMSHGAAAEAGRPADSRPSRSMNNSAKPATTISGKISSNTQLASKLQPLLPAGMTMEQASAGFRNQGQFIAALHVSQNLGIPFADLQSKMTGADAVSLGKAIQTLKPSLDSTTVKSEVTKAETEAKTDLSSKPAKSGKKQS